MARRNGIPALGEVFEVPYPYVRDTWLEHDEDEGGPVSHEVPTWKPGVRHEERRNPRAHPDVEPYVVSVADAMGAQLLTVVGVYQPHGFPTRVFYTRQWRDPDGKLFGKANCRITTVPAFRSLTSGYRHDFELVAVALPARGEE